MWCIQQITPQYRARMYRLLDLYKMKHDKNHPIVCLDEKSKQLLENNRKPIAAKPGSVEKCDYEYKRNGTCNIFVAVVPKTGIRYTKVTDTRKKEDFAYFVQDLVEIHFANIGNGYIQLVMDNLNTHFEGSLIETFGEQKTKQLMKKLRFIYTPKHASWLNMAEIEINIMDRQCTGGRIANKKTLTEMLEKWTVDRNEKKCHIEWKFTRQDADKKLSKHYVS